MNEKATSSSKSPEHKLTAAELDKYVDTRNVSYDDAYRHFGVTPEEVDFTEDHNTSEAIQLLADMEEGPKTALEALRPAESGPSLSLLARAKALDIIMRQFNQENKTQGAQEVHDRDYNNAMLERYGVTADEVLDNMHKKAARMGTEAVHAIDILAGGDSGVPMDSASLYSGSIEASLRREFGPGKADSRKREKLMTKVYHTAGTTKAKQRREI